jgi:hypothetical protein
MRDRLLTATRTWLNLAAGWTPLAMGGLCGSMLCLWWSQTLAVYGGTLTVLSGLMVAAVVGTAWGWRRGCDAAPRTTGLLLLGLGLWTLLLPFAAQWPLVALRSIAAESLSRPVAEFVFSLSAGLLLFTVPHAWLAQLVSSGWLAEHAGPRGWNVRPAPLALAAALLIIPTWVCAYVGVAALALSTAAAVVAWGVMLLWYSDECAPLTDAGAAKRSGTHRLPTSSHLHGSDLLLPLAAGGLLAISGRISSQLWLNGLYCGFASAAGVLCGMLIVRRCGERLTNLLGTTAGLWAAASAALLLGLFGPLTALALWVNADVSTLSLIVGLRALCGAALSVPAGVIFGLSMSRSASRTARPWSAVAMLMFVLGWIFTRWTAPDAIVAAWIVIAAAAIHFIASTVRAGRQPWSRAARCAAAAALLCCCAAPWLVNQYNPGRSARLLFSGRVAAASHSPADADLLEALDDTRLLQMVAGHDSVWTTWTSRGDQVQWRENGYPHAAISRDLAIAPESACELMSAVIPLTVHPHADHVLVVGAGSGATLRSALEFPVQSLTCWEPDADALQLLAGSLHGDAAAFLSDSRLALRRLNPTIAAGARASFPFDVIVLNERQQATWRTIGWRNSAAYQRWSERLTPQGVLCQRIEYVDFGAAPLLDLVRTVSAVFPQVLVWESAPGELLVLATKSDQPLVDDSLLDRFQSPQVRRTLGRMGWDCSLPLSLVTVRGEDLLQASAAGTTAIPARAHCEFAWPVEIARWGPKSAEIQQLLTPVAQTALGRLPESRERTAIQQRLADVQEQRSLVTRFPDHYWAYRKVLRERLQERPRATIKKLSHELHPDDERRKEYLAALGDAATTATPSLAQLQSVASFTEPFDPLVSPFLHREVALLLGKAGPDAAPAELEQWLHSVYFSPGFDRSIRDATSALTLLVQHPETMDDAARRWDHLNALLEVLKERWALRSQQTTLSKYEASDVGETIDAAANALAYLQAHAGDAGIDPEWAELRCRVLERTLVRALRSHHAQQVAKQQALARQQAAREQSNVQR